MDKKNKATYCDICKQPLSFHMCKQIKKMTRDNILEFEKIIRSETFDENTLLTLADKIHAELYRRKS